MTDLAPLVHRFLEHVTLCPTCARVAASSATSEVPTGLCFVGMAYLRELIAVRKGTAAPQ